MAGQGVGVGEVGEQGVGVWGQGGQEVGVHERTVVGISDVSHKCTTQRTVLLNRLPSGFAQLALPVMKAKACRPGPH